jgi:PEP-CTERM motif
MRIRFPGLLSGAVAILLLPVSASAGPILCSERGDCFAWYADEIGGVSGDTREFGDNPFVSELHEAVAAAFTSGDGDGFSRNTFAQPTETLSVALAISSTAISEADLPIARVMAALTVNGDSGLPVGELPSPPAPAGGSTPEPATLLLFGTGLFAVRALSGRRRR